MKKACFENKTSVKFKFFLPDVTSLLRFVIFPQFIEDYNFLEYITRPVHHGGTCSDLRFNFNKCGMKKVRNGFQRLIICIAYILTYYVALLGHFLMKFMHCIIYSETYQVLLIFRSDFDQVLVLEF